MCIRHACGILLIVFGLTVLFQPVFAAAADGNPSDDTTGVYPVTFEKMFRLCTLNRSGEQQGSDHGVISDVCGDTFPKIDRQTVIPKSASSSEDVNAETRRAGGSEASALFNQSAILFGLTDFLIERAEVEAETFLLDRFAKDVCKERDDAISGNELLRTTCSVFDTKDRSLTLLIASGSILRTTLLQDLRGLPRTVPAAMYERSSLFTERQWLVSAYLLGTVVEEMLKNEGVVASIKRMPVPDGLNSEFEGIGSAPWVLPDVGALSLPQRVYFASRVFQAFPIKDGRVQFPQTPEQWKDAIRAVYLNIAYYDHNTKNVNTFRDALQRAVSEGNVFAQVRTQYNELDTAIKRLVQARDKDAEDPSDETAAAVRRSAGIVAHNGIASIRVTLSALLPPGGERTASEETLVDILTGMENVSQSLVALDYASFSAHFVLLARDMGVDLPSEVTRIVFLGGELANASDASSAKSAIKSFAAPPGGYLRKKVGRGSYLTLDAYAGVHGMRDYTTEGDIGQGAWGSGALLPLGIEFGYGFDNGWNAAAFAQVLDLGVLASYRIKGPEEVDALPEIGVQQVISPGVFVVVGLPNAPVSFLGGVAYAPKLRNITTEGSVEERSVGSLRVSLGFALDLTLFP